ncbi:MAG TPA: endopeptidase La [bacterium]|nr:endopeptidase La [bacterium]
MEQGTPPIRPDQIKIPPKLPVLALKDSVLFPFMIMPVFVSRDFSIASVNQAISSERLLFVTAQRKVEEEALSLETVYEVGCVASILKMQKLFDGRIKLLIQGVQKAEIQEITKDDAENCYYALIDPITEIQSPEATVRIEALVKNVRDGLDKLTNLGDKNFPPDIVAILNSITDPARLAELVVSHLSNSIEISQRVLEENDVLSKLAIVNEFIEKELSLLEIQNDIRNKAKERMGKAQKEYFLKEQMKQIQKELGTDDPYNYELEEYAQKIKNKNFPDNVRTEAEKQLTRLRSMNPAASEVGVIKTYLDTLIELPWDDRSEDNKNLNKAQEVLEEDHYGLEDIKERILEFLAVRQVKGNTKSPILCFIGPPGVGKTSLGKSIARALGRKFYRMSLGGMHDEAEIRGHRRTYVGAMPGKILEGIKNCGTVNPVFMLDEIDKVGKDWRGDPSSALLEVLDPEQNFSFTDNYLGLPYNLSEVFFIATANWEETIPAPLKDRMETITLSGYTDPEKIQIAHRYLIPRQLENNGLTADELKFSDESILFIIRRYTREAGVRELERKIGSICRKSITLKTAGKKMTKKVSPELIEKYLKLPPFSEEEFVKEERVGVVTGLAWTMHGGTTLKIEVNGMEGSGQLILTGHLGDVMKESARIALSYIKSNRAEFGLPKNFSLEKQDIHIHFPAGAVPKDGPSAGITITTALLSLFLKKTVNPAVGMTGEISLTGKVLPIGGLKEKMLAAKRNGLTAVIVPQENKPLYDSIPAEIRDGIGVSFVSDYREVFKKLFKR